MPNKRKDCFPMIRTREEILSHIRSRDQLSDLFDSWRKEEQKEFLDFQQPLCYNFMEAAMF